MADHLDQRTPHAERARRLLRRAVTLIYILQVPLFLGLMLALVVFGATFFYAILDAVITLEFLDRNRAILLVLDLLDMVFIANLIVMVMVSGYNAYYSNAIPDRDLAADPAPRDAFAPVKSRIAATLVIISGIHLVHEVLAGEMASPTELLVLALLHLVLLATAAVFAYLARAER